MHNGTIEWNGRDLGQVGKPRLNIQRQPDPPAPASASRMLVTLTVTVALEALDPGTILARCQWLASAMRCGEGILRVSHGTGAVTEWLAVPGENNLAEALTGTSNEVVLAFTAIENHGAGTLAGMTGASFTPAGSSTPVALHAVREMREDVRTTRHSERASARSATTTSLSFIARVAMADMSASVADRTSYLQSVIQTVKALDTHQGTLAMNGSSHIVRVTEFSPTMDERKSMVEVNVQCHYITLPNAGSAEATMESDSRVDEGSGEEVISLSGSIEAETREIALAKLNALRAAQHAITGRRVVSWNTKDKVIDGYDTDQGASNWTGGLSYSIEARQNLSGGRHTLRITTRKDIRAGMAWTYSGSVTGMSGTDALALARGIAAAQSHPVLVRSEETLEESTDISHTPGAARNFMKLDFSYEFEGPVSGFISGEMTWEEATLLAGEWRRTLSGYLLSVDRETSEARFNSLCSGQPVALDKTLRWTETYLDKTGNDSQPAVNVSRLDFTASYRRTRTYAAVEYADTADVDYATMLRSRDLSGTLWSDTREHAETALADFITFTLGATKPLRLRTSHALVAWGSGTSQARPAEGSGGSQWIKLDFSFSASESVSGTTGYDLLEASYTMERTGGLNQVVVTPIPFSRPVAQVATGYLPGRISINATAKAVNLATAKAWVQGARALAGGGGHETDQPRESSSPTYAPMSGSSALTWTFSGSYGWTYVDGLDGIW